MVKNFALKNLEILPRDFEFTFNEGVYLFEGPNGAGKTTVLDSLHPHDTFISRNISVRDILKPGGVKEITLTKGNDEFYFRIYKGKSFDEFFIQKNGSKYLLTKSVTEYKKAVNNLFPKRQMSFLQLHSRIGRLSQVSNSDFKKMLLQLADSDIFEYLRDIVKDKINDVEKSLANVNGQLQGLTFNQKQITQDDYDRIKTDYDKLLKSLENTVNEISVYEENKELYVQLSTKLTSLNSVLSNLHAEKSEFDELLPKYTTYKERIKALPQLKKQLEDVSQEYNEKLELKQQLLSKLTDKLNICIQTLTNIESKLNDITLLDQLPCSNDLKTKCPLVTKTVAEPKETLLMMKEKLIAKRDKLLNKKEILEGDFNEVLSGFKLKITELNNQINKLRDIENDVNKIEGKLDRLKVIDKELQRTSIEQESVNMQLQNLNYSSIKHNQLIQQRDTLLNKKASLEALLKEYEDILNKQEIINSLTNKKNKESKMQERLSILKKCFSVNEMPALELINVISLINQFTNELFIRFKDEFSIHISLKDDAKQSLQVIVTKNGVNVPFSVLSDGESVWVDKFLRFALAFIVRKKHSYFDYLYCDEGEGALYHGVREKFLLMHKSLVTDYGFKQLFMVSHDVRANQLFENVISF